MIFSYLKEQGIWNCLFQSLFLASWTLFTFSFIDLAFTSTFQGNGGYIYLWRKAESRQVSDHITLRASRREGRSEEVRWNRRKKGIK